MPWLLIKHVRKFNNAQLANTQTSTAPANPAHHPASYAQQPQTAPNASPLFTSATASAVKHAYQINTTSQYQ